MTRPGIVVYAMALTFALAGCSHAGGMPPVQPTANLPSSGPLIAVPVPADPQTLAAAEAAAQVAFDRLFSGDYAGAWQMYTNAGRAAITQADFVRLNTTCPGAQNLRATIASGRLATPDKALIVVTVPGAVATYTMDYQAGHWYIEPTPPRMALCAEGVDKAIAGEKAAGAC